MSHVNCVNTLNGKWEYFTSVKVDLISASSACTAASSLLFCFMSTKYRRKCFSTCGNQRKIVFAWVSGWISLLYQRVICLHWFKLFLLDKSLFTYMHDTYLLVCTDSHTRTRAQTLISSPSGLTVSLIYEVPLIWPKRSLRDLPPLSSLRLCIPLSLPPSHQSLSRVNQRGGIAHQAIHRLDTLTNMPLSFSLPPFLSPCLSNSLRPSLFPSYLPTV